MQFDCKLNNKKLIWTSIHVYTGYECWFPAGWPGIMQSFEIAQKTWFKQVLKNMSKMWIECVSRGVFLHQRSALDPLRQEFEVEIWPEKWGPKADLIPIGSDKAGRNGYLVGSRLGSLRWSCVLIHGKFHSSAAPLLFRYYWCGHGHSDFEADSYQDNPPSFDRVPLHLEAENWRSEPSKTTFHHQLYRTPPTRCIAANAWLNFSAQVVQDMDAIKTLRAKFAPADVFFSFMELGKVRLLHWGISWNTISPHKKNLVGYPPVDP